LEKEPEITDDDMLERLLQAADAAYDAKVAIVGREPFAGFERSVMLHSVDSHWREHLAALDHLRQGIHLRGYAHKNPKQEYKREAFELFTGMLEAIKTEVTRILMTVQIRNEQQVESAAEAPAPRNLQYHHATYSEAADDHQSLPENQENKPQPFVRKNDKI